MLPVVLRAGAAPECRGRSIPVTTTPKTRGEANQSLHFVPFGAKFDINGFLLSPDLLSFSAQPEVSAGPQASEAGFQGGNGVRWR